jgi:alginate O-acetyltransferase complex protein AlgI
MLFNSLEFLIFFAVVFVLFFRIPYNKRWLFMLAASYIFYMSWSPKFIILIILSTVVDYYAAIKMGQQDTQQAKKKFLWLSLIVNLGMLASFKYLGFLDETLQTIFAWVSLPYPVPEPWFNNIVLPVGISFYTFQTLSYSIDVYKGVTKPEKHFGIFALYVSFWPQLVAGPIERSNNLLPQLRKNIDFNYDNIRSGLFRMLFGFFKKVVVADRLAIYVTEIYGNYDQTSGFTVLVGAYFFAFQVYCDFSAYSDIAIGAARIFGIELMENFKRPFFSKNLAEFWTRWHISLTTWLTDYVFFFMGAYKASTAKVAFNVLFVLGLTGLWHGPKWPMILSYLTIGVFMTIRFIWQSVVVRQIRPSNSYKLLQKVPNWIHVLITFHLLIAAFMMFRCQTMAEAVMMYKNIFKFPEAGYWSSVVALKGPVQLALAFIFLGILVCIEFIVKDRRIEDLVLNQSKINRWVIYLAFALITLWFGVFTQNEFVYFQF